MNGTINAVAARKRQGRKLLRPADVLEVIESDGIHVVQREGLHVVEGAEGIMAAKAYVQANTQPSQVAHPLGAPVINGTQITVDMMLNQATRITRMISDLSLQRFIADRVFSNGGSVSGGAVIYDVADLNELYAARDVERIEPGAEVPLITGVEKPPKVAEVEKWGGKVFITDEAKDRNDSAKFTRLMRQLTNTIIRKINARCVAEMNASIVASGQTVAGRNWNAVVTAGSSASSANQYPVRDFALAAQMAEEDELGISYDLWLLNPAQYAQLIILHGAAGLQQLLASLNLSIYVSNRVPAGTAYAVASGQVGQIRIEKPLGTETWRDPDHERTFVQSTVRPVFFVDNPFGILQFTGLQG
jgi:hypothetical protein